MGKNSASGNSKQISRRQVLQGGLVAAATAVVGGTGLLGQNQPSQAGEGQSVPAVDIHAHYFPQAYLDLIASEGKRFGASYKMTPKGWLIRTPAANNGPLPNKFIDLKERLADMDAQGISVQALSLTAPMVYWGDEDFSHKLSVAWNDAASAAHQTYPARLVALLTLPMPYPERALDELNRASKLPGMRGVYIGTNVNHRDLDDPLFEPVFTRIEQLDLPIFLHPIEVVGGQRMKPFFLFNLLGNPFDTTIAAAHLIFGGVLDRHPKLTFGLSHAGGALPLLIGRLDQGWKVRSEVPHLPQPPSAYLKRFVYDTIIHSKSAMEFVINAVGAERVMIGSDYCFNTGYARPLQFLQQLELTTAQRLTIRGGNAVRLLKL